MTFSIQNFRWTRQPAQFLASDDHVQIVTKPHTDLWQRTYYHFRNDNAPVFQMETEKKYFSFTVRTEFESKHRFDQCGIVMYLDSENWLKASIEYENEQFQHLGSVVTNLGYSDWATTAIDASIKSMWYRLWNALRTVNSSARCVCAICTRAAVRSVLASMPAARKILPLKRLSLKWR